MPRQASSTTKTAKPSRRASSAENRTQKSKARPAKNTPRPVARAQIADEAGRRGAIVFVERRIGIDRARHALAQHQRGMRNVERGVERGAVRALHAMVRPQRLRTVRRDDGLERLLARMRRREGKMPGRMPVLRQHHIAKPRRQPIDHRHDFIAARHGERAARTEIVLHVDDDEDVASSMIAASLMVLIWRPRYLALAFCACMRRSNAAASS